MDAQPRSQLHERARSDSKVDIFSHRARQSEDETAGYPVA